MEMDTRVALYLNGILDIEAVETDGVLTDRRGEGVLHQADLVVVEVDIGEDILHDHVEDITCLEEVIDTR